MNLMKKESKNFDDWNNIKKKIDFEEYKDILPKNREIWWSSLGLNIGVEADGKNENYERPVLILKVFNRECFLGVPITSIDKSNKKYYFPILYKDLKSFAVLSQIKLFSTKRLSRMIYKIDSKNFIELKKELTKIAGLK
ncbi:MAG: type II toxin-antitoxin system PemK/MazF family toxin [Patescibacteria group bacterium]